MKRTHIYLPDEIYEEVRRVSHEQRKSMAQVVREALAEYLIATPVEDGPAVDDVDLEEMFTPEEIEELKKNPLYQLIGLVKTDEVDPPMPNAAVNHDYYIYLDEKP